MILNEEQSLAVHHEGHSVIVACPGSGKTRVLVERAARLHAERPLAEIVVVTFTRQAAIELRRRLSEKVATLARLRVATFHSLALQQLLTRTNSRICGPSEQMALLRRAAAGHLSDSNFRDFLSASDAYTSGDLSALDNPEYQRAYDDYLDLLAEYNAVDFSQGILKSVEGMEDGTLAPFPCNHLLVDEVQDIDAMQVRWVAAHTRAGAELTVVGDDDQSIYAFRSALGYRGMQKIQRSLDAALLRLSINYRNHDEVLGLAVSLIEHNTNRVPKNLMSAKGSGGQARLHASFWTDLEEVGAMIDHVQQSPSGWALIARSNYKLDVAERLLRERKIPFSRPGRARFWESEEPALFLGLLRPDALHDPLLFSAACTRAACTLQDRPIAALRQLLRRRRSEAPDVFIHSVSSWLLQHVGGLQADRRDGIRGIVERCRRYLLEMTGTLDERIHHATRPPSTKRERLCLLTMHAAKGLEFPAVWIFGCQDGVIPSNREANLAEERRLLYVAMTRAESELHLSFSWNKTINYRDRDPGLRRATPSRFLSLDLGLPMPTRASVDPSSQPR